MFFRITDVSFPGTPVWPGFAPSAVPLQELANSPGRWVALRRWAALLALAGLMMPGVRIESAAVAAAPVPAALAAAPALAGLTTADLPWESAMVEAAPPDTALAAALETLTDADGTPLPVAPPPGSAPGVEPAPAPAAAAPAKSKLVPAEREYLRKILIRYAQENGLPADLVMAQAWKESSWRAQVVSDSGAVGVLQLMPVTVEFVSKDLLGLRDKLDPKDPTANIRMGTRYLRYLVDRMGGNHRQALIAYNQGITSLRTKGPYRSAQRYADLVLALRSEFRTA